MSRTNRSNKLFEQTRISTLGLQDLLAFGQLQPDGTYKVRNVTNSNFLNAVVISEQITRADLLALATANELVAGKNYTITDAVGGTLSLFVFAVSISNLTEYAYDTTTGQVYSYDLATDTATNADNTGYINFTPQTAPAYQRGRVWYDSTTETLSVYDDISGTSVQLGQEEILRARNSTGSTILNGAVVYVSGAQGQNPRVSLALANSESTSKVIGVATHNIGNNTIGKITTFGIVGDLNTSAYNEGDVLYLSASVAGGLTTTRPSAPNQAVMVGTVIHSGVNDGKILVHTDNYGVGFGTANQLRGMNAGGTAEEYKTIQGTASEIEVAHTANTVTIGLPSETTTNTFRANQFVKIGGTSSEFLKADGSVDFTGYIAGFTLAGEVSGSGSTFVNVTLNNNAVTEKVLTGLSVSGSAVVSTDSILTGIGKLQNQINAVMGSVNFQGIWNASTNTPTLASGVGTKGYYYIVTVAGSTNLDGITDWKLGDWAIYDGTAWQKVDNTDAVVSVNGYTGIVTLAKADIGLGNVENTALSTWAGSTNITTLSTIGTGVWQGTAIADAYIASSATWNAKIGGSGTTNYIPKFTASGAIGNSLIYDNGISIIIGATTAPASNKFQVNGTIASVFQTANDVAGRISSSATEVQIAATYDTTGSFVPMNFYTSDTKRLSILANGQIITNSASNTGEAHIFGGSARVNGAFLTEGTTTILSSSSSSAGLIVKGGSSIGSPSVASGQIFVGATATYRLSMAYDDNTGYAYIDNLYDNANSNIYIRTRTNGTPVNALTILGTGNVGIGTTSPSQGKLEVNGDISINNLNVSNNALTNAVIGYFKGDARLNGAGASFGGMKIITDATLWYKGRLGFFTNNIDGTDPATPATEKMSIMANGNVLIGTTTDDGVNKLQVSGSARVNAISGYGRFTLNGELATQGSEFNLSGGSVRYASIMGEYESAGKGKLILRTFINSGIDVGGSLTIASSGAATFSSSVSATGYLINNGSFRGGLFTYNALLGIGVDYTPTIYAETGLGLYFVVNGNGASRPLVITSAGNIGINNSTPSYKLDVGGTLGVAGAATFSSSVQATTLKLTSLPTSSAGLSAGDLWNNGGVVNIV